MHISMRYVNTIWKNYREHEKQELKKKGPKPLPITFYCKQAAMDARRKHPDSGAISMGSISLNAVSEYPQPDIQNSPGIGDGDGRNQQKEAAEMF